MTINFWEAQRRGHRKTRLYLLIFIFLTFFIGVLLEIGMHYFGRTNYESSFPIFGLAFLCVTFAVAGFHYLQFSSNGGIYVAEALGGQRVLSTSADLKEKQLLNIVEEMALAASLPTPAVYLLKANQMNAFAAGTKPTNAAIAVTDGALNKLNREELQGVIAHEFGHIYNGDMVISLRLAAMVLGFFFVFYLGLRILQVTSYKKRLSEEDNRGSHVLLMAALLLIAAGALTWLMGSILKSAVSREREYLADACAVQFTRNPSGIASALRKIEKETVRDMPLTGSAYSHLYFNDLTAWGSLFQTHPPLDKRIAALENKEYVSSEWTSYLSSEEAVKK